MGVGIEVANLNAWYGANHTLQDINLNIPANHATALIGPSGCGKSTFVRCLNRMHETNPIARVTGTVRIGDLDIYEDAKPVEIRRRVGMVFQRPNPFPTMSIYDNVAAGLKLNGYTNRHALDEIVEHSLKNSALWDEVKDDLKKKSGRQPFRRPAAAAVHCDKHQRTKQQAKHHIAAQYTAAAVAAGKAGPGLLLQIVLHFIPERRILERLFDDLQRRGGWSSH